MLPFPIMLVVNYEHNTYINRQIIEYTGQTELIAFILLSSCDQYYGLHTYPVMSNPTVRQPAEAGVTVIQIMSWLPPERAFFRIGNLTSHTCRPCGPMGVEAASVEYALGHSLRSRPATACNSRKAVLCDQCNNM